MTKLYQSFWYGSLFIASACLLLTPIKTASGQSGRLVRSTPQTSAEAIDLDMYGRIRTEGQTHGHAMDFASALADGIGPRLTGSPNMKKANEWARETLTTIGLENSHLEDWGEFGMGWYQINTWGRSVTPEPEPIWMQAAVWSSATSGPVTGEIVYLPLNDASELDAVQGKLKGKIVLLGTARPASELDQQLSFRYTEDELKELEGPEEPRRSTGPPPANAASRTERRRVGVLRERAAKMAQEEGAAAILLPSHEEGRNVDTGLLLDDNGVELARNARIRENAVTIPYAVVMTEHYTRLARLALAHVPVKVEVNIQTAFTGDHEHGFNTVAEIPGTDPKLKEQVVMVGGHLDSWPSGTGATDNGAGVVVAMEAVRILKALGVKPRRTIRIALWSGEEQGELGSRGYVKSHFGGFEKSGTSQLPGPLQTTKEWETLDAYFNLDEGGGQIRGIYTQGNYAVAPIFAQWIAPLKDLGVTTVTNRKDPGSDHESFDAVGLPGFNFLQDEMDYETRTHHSNLDTVDHLRRDDLEQAAIVEAIFLWNSSERDEMLPRKPKPDPEANAKSAAPLAGLFPGSVSDSSVPKSPHLYGDRITLPLVVIKGYPFLEGSINGKSGKLLFDLGEADAFCLDSHTVMQAGGISAGKGNFGSGQTFERFKFPVVDSLKLTGGLHFEKMTDISGNPGLPLERHITPDFIGWIGVPFWQGYVFKLDYMKPAVTFYRDDTTGGGERAAEAGETLLQKIAFTNKTTNIPLFPIKLGEQPVNASFDTGAHSTAWFSDDEIANLEKAGVLHKDGEDYLLSSITIDGKAIEPMRIEVIHSQPPFAKLLPQPDAPLVVFGYEFHSRYKTVWDYGHGIVTLLQK